MSINVSEKKLKSKVKIGEQVAVIENIKYPHFESQKHTKLCKKMNDFYSSVAEKYSGYAHGTLVKKIKLNRVRCKLPMSVSMNYTIALNDEKFLSVVLDLVFSTGKEFKTRRFSQMWSAEKGDILSLSELLNTDRRSRKKIYSLILSSAKENAENPAFGYFGDYLVRLNKNFDVRNCFAVPNGICFFINSGILSPKKYGVNGFVVPYGKLDGIIKGDFLPKTDEKEAQNADIVNNV